MICNLLLFHFNRCSILCQVPQCLYIWFTVCFYGPSFGRWTNSHCSTELTLLKACSLGYSLWIATLWSSFVSVLVNGMLNSLNKTCFFGAFLTWQSTDTCTAWERMYTPSPSLVLNAFRNSCGIISVSQMHHTFEFCCVLKLICMYTVIIWPFSFSFSCMWLVDLTIWLVQSRQTTALLLLNKVLSYCEWWTPSIKSIAVTYLKYF